MKRRGIRRAPADTISSLPPTKRRRSSEDDDNNDNNSQASGAVDRQWSRESQQQQRRCVCLPKNHAPGPFPVVWSELRSKRQLCDVVLRCSSNDEREYHVHRLVLSSVSPYFRVLFTNQLNNGSIVDTSNRELTIPDSDPDVLELLLDYAYTGNCDVDAVTVERLLPLADRLDIVGIVQLCCRFLLDELNPDNCLGIYKFARHYFCRDLEERGRRYILKNFKDIYQRSPEFKDLACQELEQIINDDELNVRNEELVFEALKSWVEERAEERARYLPRLIDGVRYGLMEPDYFKNNVLTWKIAQNECRGTLLSIKAYLSKRSRRHQTRRPSIKDKLARPRVPHEILFAVGGWCADWSINYVETYDARADRWLISSCRDVTPRSYHGICAINNLVYVIGGHDGRRFFNTTHCFDPIADTWTEKACMHHARCFVSVCDYDNKIYALGGNNSLTRMNSCERYDPVANQWTPLPPMNEPRSDASAAAIDGKIYVAGGYNGYDIFDTVEVYDVVTNQWSYVSPMTRLRTGLSLVAHRGCLYALGGFDGVERHKSCEKYDPNSQDGWQEVADMRCPRSNFTTAILDDKIYAIGGYDEPHTLSRVEYYDANNNEWREAQPMILARSALRACVVAGITNARKHTYHQQLVNKE